MLSDININLLRFPFEFGSMFKLSPYKVVNGECSLNERSRFYWRLELKTGIEFYLARLNAGFLFLSRCLVLFYFLISVFRNAASVADKIMMSFLAVMLSYGVILQAFFLSYYQGLGCLVNEMMNLCNRGKFHVIIS